MCELIDCMFWHFGKCTGDPEAVARLMEIFEICDVMSEETRNNLCCIPSIKRMSYMQYMMKCFTYATETKSLDFLKLEE